MTPACDMPRKTQGERIEELGTAVTQIQERLDAAQRELNRFSDIPVRMALLEQRVHDMQQGWERWLQRAWMILAPLVGAVAGSLPTYYFASRR